MIGAQGGLDILCWHPRAPLTFHVPYATAVSDPICLLPEASHTALLIAFHKAAGTASPNKTRYITSSNSGTGS